MAAGAPAAPPAHGDAAHYDSCALAPGEAPLEWYAGFDALQPLLRRHISLTDSLLVLGPGASSLQEALYDSGYRGVTCVDLNAKARAARRRSLPPPRQRPPPATAPARQLRRRRPEAAGGQRRRHAASLRCARAQPRPACRRAPRPAQVLQAWRQRAADGGRSSLRFQLADIVEGLPYEHCPYDAIIDKGTLDCVACRERGMDDAAAALSHVHANVKQSSPSGVFIMVSHAGPELRLPLLERQRWEGGVQVKVLLPPRLDALAAGGGGEGVVVRDWSAALAVPPDAAYVYVCKRSYCCCRSRLSASHPTPAPSRPSLSSDLAMALLKLTAVVALALLAPALAAPSDDGHFATCTEALASIPGYSHTATALSNCPDLQAMQSDASLVKTFFVPSNAAIEGIAAHIGLPVEKVIGPDLKAVMCNFLKYHIVNGAFPLADWTVGKTFNTNYFGARLSVNAVGDAPVVKSMMGVPAGVERVATCGSAVAYGIDTVLTPFPVPKLG
ncbi:eef1aknmt [Scenedesmus sp. PABB004]|nr:eef1aknmt [Scenedesmus sp. PABB004]